MKKILAICLMIIMVVSISFSAFAVPNGFVSSPSGNPAPTVVSFDTDSEGCDAKLKITPSSERNTLSEFLATMMEKAYTSIVDSEDLTNLNSDFKKLVADKNISPENLAVSDLFDAHISDCDVHDGHVNLDIVLKANTLKRFVALLHMNKKGEWELVKDAKVTKNGEHLEFSVDSLSPFAIVVETGDDASVSSPQTGENNRIYIYVVLMAVSALMLAIVVVKSKKQKD